ncbi:hypothetical protein Pcac1_g17320 [Phytophthora cactorum]|nr:hypothetical protein Pcac1_g17320 [Phytophthora cactorum]KAG3114282.1 hypothetical protein C6341_g27710 [Phytophthora cactorum]KAG3147839.1 hypothetical protein PC128_g23707 [Phytophthora cactorum]
MSSLTKAPAQESASADSATSVPVPAATPPRCLCMQALLRQSLGSPSANTTRYNTRRALRTMLPLRGLSSTAR